ncbi:peptidylprolyl isomerase [Phenylobacterium sp.]|uniref:peptidylprolyl isomerase n=1 Tax=Phenylobacterium sp. TaxID=1871053 RepID=UPI0025D872ED|nr:peptidylprolyl isomerase [Phenylobacterium sp.]
MLSSIRNFAKSWPARILMAILAVSFVGWGINRTGFQAVNGDEVIRAGSRTTDSFVFKREYDNYKKRLEGQQQGQPIPQDMAEANHLDTVVLNGLATREAFSELLSRSGIHPSDKLILAQLEKIPAFFDPITGRFDKKTYQRRLADNSMTPKMLDAEIRDGMAAQNWGAGLQNGLAVPRAYGALGSVFALETRDLSYFLVTPQSVPQPPAPTDAQLAAFVAENRSRLSLPEMRLITVVAFAPPPPESLGPVDPAALKKRYDFRKDTLSKPETRTLVQIPAKTPAIADQVVARLGRGEAPAAIAKSLGVEPVEFADKPVTAIPDRKAGVAAFKMMPGQVGAVQGDLGLTVIKVVSVTAGREITLEEARPMLEAELRKTMAAEKVYAQAQAFDDAHQGGATLAQAAAKAGAEAKTLGPISAQGVDAQHRQLQGFPPKILQLAFSLPAGGESEITELGNGVSFAVRVEKVIPAHVPPLDEIRADATREWQLRELVKAMETRATALSARIDKGEALDAVAASAGYAPVKVAALSRQTAQAHPEVPREILGRAFGSKPGEVWTTRAPNALAVGRVENVHMDPSPEAARLAETNRAELSAAVFREMAESAQAYSRTKLKVKVDAARARAAAGFGPLSKDGAKPAEKKG